MKATGIIWSFCFYDFRPSCQHRPKSNKHFKLAEFREFKNDSATHSFAMNPSQYCLKALDL